MSSRAATVADYFAELDPQRRVEIEVRDEIDATTPAEFIALYERIKPPPR